MNLLAGLYPLKIGKLSINSNELKDARLDLVFVSQEVDLFDLSIRDNLCLGKEISDERILELIKEAGLIGWFNELPQGLDTMTLKISNLDVFIIDEKMNLKRYNLEK